VKVGDLVIFEGNHNNVGIVLEIDVRADIVRVYFSMYRSTGSWFFSTSLRVIQ
jgi:hypothetical protein